MEKVFVAKSKTVDPNKTLICGTRYGNVMASRGWRYYGTKVTGFYDWGFGSGC